MINLLNVQGAISSLGRKSLTWLFLRSYQSYKYENKPGCTHFLHAGVFKMSEANSGSSKIDRSFFGLWRYRSMVWRMTKKEISGKYRGSFLGIFWAIISPIMMLTIYTFVFSVVLKARWGGADQGNVDFAIIFFAGLIVYFFFAECINGAPLLLVSHTSYIKKTIFPIEILPLVATLTSFFHALMSFVVLAGLFLFIYGYIHWTIIFLPIVITPFILLSLGLVWVISSVGVYVKDINHVVSMVTTALLFLSPIFYPASALPEFMRPVFHLNPLTFIIEQTRDIMLWGKIPNFSGLFIYYVLGLSIAFLGLHFFHKLKKSFAEVL